jgi:hypothetical protein
MSEKRISVLAQKPATLSKRIRWFFCAYANPIKLPAIAFLVVLSSSLSHCFAATTYYASPTGASGNTGRSISSPWPLAYAIANAGVSNTIVVMDGIYSGGSTYTPQTPYLTIKAQNKWKAIICDIAGHLFDFTTTDGSVSGITLDGLCLSNSLNEAIDVRSGSNHVIRNCWVVDTGKTPGGASQSQTGITIAGRCVGMLVENNLVERNGRTANFDHGIYIGGTNHVIRNNVVRNNYAYGITLFAHSPWSVNNCRVYNNLVYDNGVLNTDGNTDGIDIEPGAGNEVNYVYGNTIISTNGYGIMGGGVSGCVLYMTNNIIISSRAASVRWLTGVAYGDYNLAPFPLAVSGPHDVITSSFGFVTTNTGLYWLTSGSAARGKALPAVAGPVDFFGNLQSSVSDIGAFQYSSAYASDSRILDPSPANPDYWSILTGTNSGRPQPPQGLHVLVTTNLLSQAF